MADPAPDTVGIVIVSHSRALADAAVALASEMVHGQPLRIAVAAGLDDVTFGTDAVRIKQAIEAVDAPAGVVVLMDLGSALLSAELALDLLDDPTMRDRVQLSAAPLVEGLVVAAVSAAGGASRLEVATEAREALLAKASQLGAAGVEEPPAPGHDAEATGSFVVANPHGLHARPAARLVSEMRQVDAVVLLRNRDNGRGPVPATSLSRVATLAALPGNTVEISASGRQADEAVRRLLELARRRFGEVDEAPGQMQRRVDQPSRGPMPAAPGVAVGPVRHLSVPPLPQPASREVDDAGAEWRRLADAVASVRAELTRLEQATARDVGAAEAAVFEAHQLLLDDDELLDAARGRIEGGASAGDAWSAAIDDVHESWARLPDAYLQARAADVRAVGDQVLRRLAGVADAVLRERGVLVAHDLTPAETARLDLALVQGIVLAGGAATSHAAILARARGIPAVVAAGEQLLAVAEATTVAIDGGTGEVVVSPTPDQLAAFESRRHDQATARARDLATAVQPALTRDGHLVHVGANLGSVDDARAAAVAGADDAGLVRTEFLFLGRDHAPSADEQHDVYSAISKALDGKRITLRTLDVGGDKPLPYAPSPAEQNPFLGLRGLRMSLQEKALFRDQLQAVCRTAMEAPIDLMFPMVSQVDELLEALDRLHEAAGPEGLPQGLRVGMMVEVPAAALNAQAFVPHLDFFSIGTNDLTQYALAAERGNPYVAALSDALDPGVLRLVAATCQAAEGKVEVSVCGEAAADLQAVPVLLGLGVAHLSVSPAAVPAVKTRVRELDLAACRHLAAQALSVADARAVRRLVETATTR
jgi:phosphocarrier protein FPr